VRYYYYNYYSSDDIRKIHIPAFGSVLYDIHVFAKAGGYFNWKCQGDFEFFQRTFNNFSEYAIEDFLYYHRIRKDSLMYNNDTSMDSEYRWNLQNQIITYNF